MHVEISVALNFVISYLYNKLPRRRVDLFGEELEVGLKQKFEGHWYPERPSKGSGFRCVKGNGDGIDPVLVEAAAKAGLDIFEVKTYLPEDLTIWIDPAEVSYKIGERGVVKVLYSEPSEDKSVAGTAQDDSEIQAVNRGFNPDAETFTPEALQQPTLPPPSDLSFSPPSLDPSPTSSLLTHTNLNGSPPTFTPDLLAFTPDVTAFCTNDSSSLNQSLSSFQPIDSLSSSLSNLSMSPSSPVPPPGPWSTATSPSNKLFSSASPSSMMNIGNINTSNGHNSSNSSMLPLHHQNHLQSRGLVGIQQPPPAQAYMNPPRAVPVATPISNGQPTNRQHFTAAMFAQTKFGSTKLKTQVKRPNRLSPTELGNFARHQPHQPHQPPVQQQQQHQQQLQHQRPPTVYAGPQRPRSLSPRDPRVEFLMDQQQRFIMQQHHHHQQQQQQQQNRISPSMPYPPQFQPHQQPQHLFQLQQQQQQQQQQLSPNGMTYQGDFLRQQPSGLSSCQSSPHLSPHTMSPQGPGVSFQDLLLSSNSPGLSSPSKSNGTSNFPSSASLPSLGAAAPIRPTSLSHYKRPSGFPALRSAASSPLSQASTPDISSGNSTALSPDGHQNFADSLNNMASMNQYSNSLQHLLMAN